MTHDSDSAWPAMLEENLRKAFFAGFATSTDCGFDGSMVYDDSITEGDLSEYYEEFSKDPDAYIQSRRKG